MKQQHIFLCTIISKEISVRMRTPSSVVCLLFLPEAESRHYNSSEVKFNADFKSARITSFRRNAAEKKCKIKASICLPNQQTILEGAFGCFGAAESEKGTGAAGETSTGSESLTDVSEECTRSRRCRSACLPACLHTADTRTDKMEWQELPVLPRSREFYGRFTQRYHEAWTGFPSVSPLLFFFLFFFFFKSSFTAGSAWR